MARTANRNAHKTEKLSKSQRRALKSKPSTATPKKDILIRKRTPSAGECSCEEKNICTHELIRRYWGIPQGGGKPNWVEAKGKPEGMCQKCYDKFVTDWKEKVEEKNSD